MAIIVKKSTENPDVLPVYTNSLQDLKLFVGLGNPGVKYQNNRHNFGFMCLDKLSQIYDLQWQDSNKFKSHITETTMAETRIIACKPQTYMNLSAEAVIKLVDFYRIQPEKVFIIHDEIRLDFGTIETKISDNTYNHNGLRSLSQIFKNQPLNLIRVGIGPKQPQQISLADFVLSNFNLGQQQSLNKITKEVCSIIGEISAQDMQMGKRSVIE